MKRTLVLLAAALTLAGCGDPPPESGYVYAKQAEPGYYSTSYVCAGYDSKTGACTVQVPITSWNPPTWALCLEADNPGEDGKKARGCRDVTQDVYGRYEVGQHYPDPA